MSKILVTGGCGYIGSHTITVLLDQGYDVISIDNFMNSFPDVLHGIQKISGKEIVNYEVDLVDADALKRVFSENPDIEGVIHFAALKSVNESVSKPLHYYRNNLVAVINLCECMLTHDINNFIFSSSCTVYGQPEVLPVTEASPLKEPESPYGKTKQMSEYILKDCAYLKDLNVISLRYFNPAGAHPSAIIGEASRVRAVNLVPVITETAIGKRDKCIVYGDDYPTRDGSCIRDYIHIMDLARAHTLALRRQYDRADRGNYDTFNLGIGQGVTVLEAIRAFERSTGVKLNFEIGPRRPGDVIAIYSDFEKAREQLGWYPKYTIEDIMASAWQWEKKRTY